MIIAIDAMGGDFGPKETIPGALLAIKDGIEAITLVGQKKEIQKELKKHQASDNPHISIVNATETVEMSESPTQSFKSKKDSSIRVGLELVKNKKADAFISCGNTGAVMFASIMTLGRMKGVERPAISGIIPTEKGPMVLLDLGSNVDCKPEHLFQFGIMGHYFAEHILHIKTPKIGLLNIGEEKDKGNNLTLNTYSKLEEADINFIGNIEGKELLSGKANVVVCDGFTGNTVLKFGEGIAKLFTNFFKQEAKKSLLSLLGLFLLKKSLKQFKKKFDYDEYGGATLLGINGISIIAHGNANAIAVKNAIKTAKEAYDTKIVEKMSAALNKTTKVNS